MDEEPKSPAELKEIRLNRRRAQEVEGVKAMAEIAAADVAIRKRTEKLRALRLAKEAADRENPPEPTLRARPPHLDEAGEHLLEREGLRRTPDRRGVAPVEDQAGDPLRMAEGVRDRHRTALGHT